MTTKNDAKRRRCRCGKFADTVCDYLASAKRKTAVRTADTRECGGWIHCEALVCKACRQTLIVPLGAGVCPKYLCPDHREEQL